MENEYLSNHSIYLFHSVNSVCFQFTKALTTYRFRALSVAAMLPLSGTSSFFNDTVRFTRFFCLQWRSHKSFLLWGIKV